MPIFMTRLVDDSGGMIADEAAQVGSVGVRYVLGGGALRQLFVNVHEDGHSHRSFRVGCDPMRLTLGAQVRAGINRSVDLLWTCLILRWRAW